MQIIQASAEDFNAVSNLIVELLNELEPGTEDKISSMNLPSVTKELMAKGKIWSFLATDKNTFIGVITLHECAAIYAGGIFGEISELYVKPCFRSSFIGKRLIDAGVAFGKKRGWMRLEVGTPPFEKWHKTIKFYKKNKFVNTGLRLRRIINLSE